MVSAVLIDDFGITVTRSSTLTEEAFAGVLDDDRATFLRRYLSGPEPVEAPIDYAMAIPEPRRSDHPEEPEAPSVWEAIRNGQR